MPEQFPLTRVLARDVPGGSRTKGRLYHLDGAVTKLEGSAWNVKATVRGSHEYHVRIDRRADAFDASCECPYFFDRLTICKHIWATLLEAERRGLLLGGGTIGADASLDAVDPDAGNDPEFATGPPRAPRPSHGPGATPAPWDRFLTEFSRHLTADTRGARTPRFADAQLIYAIDRASTLATGVLAIDLMTRQRRKSGDWAKPKAAQISLQDLEEVNDPNDREILPQL